MSREMPRRRLGSVGPEIAVIGFGAAALGGAESPASWGPQDDQASLAAMRRAVDLGVNWIDTAAAYGCGHSEKVIGRFLRDLPSALRPLVFTKGGLIRSNQHGGNTFIRNLQPASVREECEASLRRLCVDQIDMYQFHWPDETGAPVEESWGAMERLIEEGKVRFAGVSNFDVALLERCEAIRHVDSLQCPLSLIRRQAAQEEVPWCLAHGVGVLGYSPMQSGLLTEAFGRERLAALSPIDWRRTMREFQEPHLSANLDLRNALRYAAERHDTTVAAVAVAWVISQPGVTAVIVGARSAEQVDGWIEGANVRLSETDFEEIAEAADAAAARKENRNHSL